MNDKLKGFILGVAVMTLLFSLTVTGFATTGSKALTATFNNIKIYVDQKLVTPKDANGNTIEPFVSGGTTYLPVRAVADALGKEVYWDNSTKSVYIGTVPTATSTPASSSTNKVLVNQNGIKIIYNGIVKSSSVYGGYDIKVTIENNSQKDCTVQVSNFSVDGIMCDPIFSCDVAAGKIAIDKIEITEDMLKQINHTSFTSFETVFNAFDPDTLADYFYSDKITIKL